ncbi:MAG: hypothetical protein AAF039_11790 [Bacteroidota bacterium]
MNSRYILSGLIFVILLSGCSSYLTSFEKVSKTKSEYEKILVIGRSKDKTARIKFENSIVEQMAGNGLKGIASHSTNGIVNINKKYSDDELVALKKRLMSNGFDGALVTNLINTEEYTDVIPGNSSTAYVPARVGRFGRYLTYYPITTWEPDQLKVGTKYVFESSLYRLAESASDNLQWVGRFEIKDPTNLENTAKNYAKDLTKAIVKSSILK